MVEAWFSILTRKSVVVHLVKDLAKLFGRVHRNDPFAVLVTFGNHLYTPYIP